MLEVVTKDFAPAAQPAIPPRTQPHNVQAEQVLLGALLLNNEHLNRISDFLLAEHFYEPVHQRLYTAINTFNDRGIVASAITLKNYFDKDDGLKDLGGADYLFKLVSLASTIINIADYGKTIYNLALRRRLIEVGEDIVNDAFDNEIELTAPEQIEKAEQQLFTLASEGQTESGFQHIKVSLTEAVNRVEYACRNQEAVSGISTGFLDMDKLLGGFQESDLLILAGRPSMGKTALAINLALNSCQFLYDNYLKRVQADPAVAQEAPPSVGFFSLEMSAEQLATRMLAMVSGINSSRLRTGHIKEEDFSHLVGASRTLQQVPFFIDDTPALSISALRTRARRLKRRNNLSMIVVDYLQLLRGVGGKGAENNRVQEVSQITQGLKAIAKELNIPVIALSQLSRAVEQREDKRPQLSDLRESGSIEQDADIVMFIYRDEYYIARRQPREGTEEFEKWQTEMNQALNLAEVIVAKQRNGPIGNVTLHYDSNTTRFSNHAHHVI